MQPSTTSATARLRCVLTHWYELRPKGEPIGSENTKRFTDIKALHMVFRRQGADALRGEILSAARSERIVEPAHLLVGAGLFPKELRIETLVRKKLESQRIEYRIAAMFGAVFFLRGSETMACRLAEESMLGKGLEQQASATALALAQQAPCAACAVRHAENWCPLRS